MSEIDRFRKHIDKVDRDLLRLLERRVGLAEKIGAAKGRKKRPVLAPDREQRIFDKLERLRPKGIAAHDLKTVFRQIIHLCRAKQRVSTVAYPGPEATFAHQAARRNFGDYALYAPCRTIEEVFEAVERERADYGMVPIENSMEGTTHKSLDCLSASALSAVAEVIVPVAYHLLSSSGKLRTIEHVYAHPADLARCRGWLAKNLAGVRLHETSSTADAAMQAALDAKAAAVASAAAKDLYHLKTVSSRIEDTGDNLTRFLAIAREPAPRTGRDKTAIVLSIDHRPGSLHDALRPFRANGLNITKIESRPSRKKAWEYHFFIEFQKHLSDPETRKALAGLKKQAVFVKILGSYPAA